MDTQDEKLRAWIDREIEAHREDLLSLFETVPLTVPELIEVAMERGLLIGRQMGQRIVH